MKLTTHQFELFEENARRALGIVWDFLETYYDSKGLPFSPEVRTAYYKADQGIKDFFLIARESQRKTEAKEGRT